MTIKTDNQRTSLKRRIRQFYELLNEQDFAACHAMIDPQVRDKASSVTLLQFENSLRDFLAAAGPIDVERIDIALHLDEPNRLYSDRDFAVGQTAWRDKTGTTHMFQERWVRSGRTWYTRTTGLIAPTVEKLPTADGKAARLRQVSRTR